MSTRAAAAASSRKTKQTLVRLLFGKVTNGPSPLSAGNGARNQMRPDPALYSFSDLRKAYLKRLQEIHPDKHHHNNNIINNSSNNSKISQTTTTTTTNGSHKEFVELQDAWDQYEKVTRQTMLASSQDGKRPNNKKEDANFTMFGVGCSFSDTPSERALRDEITDQACRGWFSAGALTSESTLPANEYGEEDQSSVNSSNSFQNEPDEENRISLVDEDWFVERDDDPPPPPPLKQERSKRAGKPSLVGQYITRRVG